MLAQPEEVDLVIEAAGGERSAVGTPGERGDPLARHTKHGLLRAIADGIHACGAVTYRARELGGHAAGRSNAGAVRAKGHAQNLSAVVFEPGDGRTIGDAQQPDRCRAKRC